MRIKENLMILFQKKSDKVKLRIGIFLVVLVMSRPKKSRQEIADTLFIGKSTVDSHRKNIIKKFNINGKTELMRFAMERKYDFM